MPAFVNSSVGSFEGTSDELATSSWPRALKKSRKRRRTAGDSAPGEGEDDMGPKRLAACAVGVLPTRRHSCASAQFPVGGPRALNRSTPQRPVRPAEAVLAAPARVRLSVFPERSSSMPRRASPLLPALSLAFLVCCT